MKERHLQKKKERKWSALNGLPCKTAISDRSKNDQIHVSRRWFLRLSVAWECSITWLWLFLNTSTSSHDKRWTNTVKLKKIRIWKWDVTNNVYPFISANEENACNNYKKRRRRRRNNDATWSNGEDSASQQVDMVPLQIGELSSTCNCTSKATVSVNMNSKTDKHSGQRTKETDMRFEPK